MINHVVLFKLKEYSLEDKSEIIEELKLLLEGLKEKTGLVNHIEVGVNYELEAKSYDIVLLSHFENLEKLNLYRIHPEHLKVFERIKETTVSRAAVDYYF